MSFSSYGYANDSFKWARQNGGRTFLDGGNCIRKNFWMILTEEHRRWKCPYPPIAGHHYARSLAMMEQVDYVLSPSSFVSRSFLEQGFRGRKCFLTNVYPIDLECFRAGAGTPCRQPPPDRHLHWRFIVAEGHSPPARSLRLVRRRHPSAQFRLTRNIHDNVLPILAG